MQNWENPEVQPLDSRDEGEMCYECRIFFPTYAAYEEHMNTVHGPGQS